MAKNFLSTYTSIPKTDGQTFSLSETNRRLRLISIEFINMIEFIKRLSTVNDDDDDGTRAKQA